MTTEIMSQHLGFSRAEQTFRDAENRTEQNLVDDYLELCSRVETRCRTYLRRNTTDIATACWFFSDLMRWNRDAWMQADHDRRIRMVETQMQIILQIGHRHPAGPATQKIVRDCKTLIGHLRWIRCSVLFDMTEDAYWDGGADAW